VRGIPQSIGAAQPVHDRTGWHPTVVNRWHGQLVLELIKRDFAGRYRGTVGGLLWSFAQPMFLLVVYTLAFGVVLQVRWQNQGDATDYALMLFAGLIVYNTVADVLQRAPTLITSHPNFVKKIVFPLELFPLVTCASALLHALIATAIWVLGYGLLRGVPLAVALLAPLVLLCMLPLLLGLGWLLSAIGVVVRDLQHATAMVGTALLFLSPVFYDLQQAPSLVRAVLLANPLTFFVEQFRAVLVHGQTPDIGSMAVYLLATTVFAGLCWMLFRRLRPTFADLL
jgi:lipopolysaccharide transport system permease protein